MDPDYEEYKDSSKFKSYVSDFSSTLALFERAKEWADLIKCLQKVTAVLKKYNQFPAVVPEKLIFCKRLSQCCNPALPSGVHTKTLETYEMVFDRLGTEKLAKDLPFYSAGLFPLFAYASMQIKPKIIEIIKTYFLPIGEGLLPCLNGLVMALVPGLEETNSEHYKIIVKLLDDIGDKVGKAPLFHALWKTLSMNSSIRIGAINYLMDRIPKTKSSEDLNVFMPNHHVLVLNAMIRAIDDPVVLVQRTVLDLLLAHFKMSEMIFDTQSLAKIIKQALFLQLRREASLNRRIYTWLLGDDPNCSQEYFTKYSKPAMIIALNDMFQEPAQTLEKAVLPYKILLALFDKPEVSAPIINEILEDIIFSLHKYSEGYSFSAEIVAQVNTVLDGLKPAVIFSFICQFIISDIESMPLQSDIGSVGIGSVGIDGPAPRSLVLIDTLLDKMVGLNSIDSITQHLPSLIISLIKAAHIAASKSHLTTILSCLHLILKVIGKMQQPVSMPKHLQNNASSEPSLNRSGSLSSQNLSSQLLLNAISDFQTFYHLLCTQLLPSIWKNEIAASAAILSAPSPNVGQKKVMIGPGSSNITISAAQPVVSPLWKRTNATIILDAASQILVAFYSCFWTSFGIQVPDPSKAPLEPWFEATIQLISESEHPIVSCLAIKTIVSFLTLPTSNPSGSKLQSYLIHSTRICHTISRKLWDLLKPSLSIIHYRAASTFLELKSVVSDICEEAICEALLQPALNLRLEAHQRFALLWRLTSEIGGPSKSFDRALFLMLDSLNDEQPIIKLACRTWLADSIGKVERILDPLLMVLLDKLSSRSTNGVYQYEYDCRRVLYAFKILQSIIECDFKLWMHNAMDKPVSKDIIELYMKQVLPEANTGEPQEGNPPSPPSNQQVDSRLNRDAYSHIPVNTYLDLLVVESLRYISGIPKRNASNDFTTKNSVVQTTAAGFLQFLLMKITASSKASELAIALQEPILGALAQSVCDTHLILQVNLLALIRCIVLIDNAADSKAKQPNHHNNNASSHQGHSTSHQGHSTSNKQPKAHRLCAIDAIGQSQMFLQTLIIGLLQANTDFNIRFYWLDFITSCIPYLQRYMHVIIPPILTCLCDIISTHQNTYDSVESKDTLMILKSMKVILHYGLNSSFSDVSSMMNIQQQSKSTSDSQQQQANQSQSSGFSGFFKTLFVGEGGIEQNPTISQQNMSSVTAIIDRIDSIMKGMIKVWGTTSPPFKSTMSDFGPSPTQEPSQSHQSTHNISKRINKDQFSTIQFQHSKDEIHNRYAVQDHVLALLEMLYHASPSKFLTSLLQDWVYICKSPEQLNVSAAMKLPLTSDSKVNLNDSRAVQDFYDQSLRYKMICIDILNHMSNVTLDSLFKALLEVLKAAHQADQQRGLKLAQLKRRGVNFTHIQDACIADMAVYIIDWGNKLIDNSLPSFLNLIRCFLSSHNPHSLFILFRLFDLYVSKSSKAIMNNSKAKKEIQLVVSKLCEVAITILNKTFVDLCCSWKYILRFTDVYDERSDPVIMDETMQQHVKQLVILHLLLSLRDHLVSILDKSFDDNRSGSNPLVSNIVHQLSSIIQSESVKNPALSQEAASVLERLANAPSLIDPKTWRKEATDLFLYWNDFLKVSSIIQLRCFEKIVTMLFTSRHEDGSVWQEFVKYLSRAVASQTIFTGSTEAAIQRALSVRRLAFILLSGATDQYLDQLPLIQEKLVEALRQRDGHGDTFAAVMLCIRVLVVRINTESLRSFWPVIISEMLGVFLAAEPDPELVFAVTKFLDLLLALPSEQFNIYEWIFITDPIIMEQSANYPFVPYLDRVARASRLTKEKNMPSLIGNLAPSFSKSSAQLSRARPLVPIQKLDVNPTPLGMTWETFLQWLSQYSSAQYLNRVATASTADMEEIHSLLLSDFALNKGLDPNDWTLMKVSTDSVEPKLLEKPVLLEPSVVNPAKIPSPIIPSSSAHPSAAPLGQDSAQQQQQPPPALDLEDNANATLFGDVLD